MAEDKAHRTMLDAAKLADELRMEQDNTTRYKNSRTFEFWILVDFPAKIISSICFRLEADRKIAEHQIHELQARLDEVEANALKNGKKAAAKLETRFVTFLHRLEFCLF